MNWSVKKFKESCIIDLPKNIFDCKNIKSLKKIVQDLAEDDYKTFYLNFGQVSKIDSTGLGHILNLYKFAFYQEINLKLYNLQPYVSQMIYQTRLNIVFDICEYNEDLLETVKSENNIISA